MDRLEALGNQLSQITMYDIKSMYEQAKNVVLNVSEIEAKVREATNDDPWGASSTLMQDIANRTFNYPDFNEIMPSIYSRFMEKEARQWRQIYKSLQLLEYLIKHGSERVVDDARAHIATIKMLRNFHYIDDKGKDQGINVRNRAKEIVELLSDVDKIRAERRKAKANKNKYSGQGNDGMSFSSSGSRYGGFGSESGGYGSYGGSSGSYGGGYGNGGSSSSFRDETNRRGFEEYNAGDDEDVAPRRSNSISTTSRTSTSTRTTTQAAASAPAPVPEVDLLGGFGDDAFGGSNNATSNPPTSFATNKALPVVGNTASPAVSLDDDDFAEFQAAPSPTTAAPAPTPAAAAPVPKMNLMEMLNSAQPSMVSPMGQPQQGSLFNTGVGNMGMGMHRSNPSLSSTSQYSSPVQTTSPPPFSPIRPATMSPTSSSAKVPSTGVAAAKHASKPSSNFDDLWTMSLGSSKPSTPVGAGKSIKDLEKEKASAGLWGSTGGGAKPPMGNANSFGAFGGTSMGSGASTSGSGNAGDDLLL
ncbi:epsin domain-containing protein [Moniliophthora roreri MCA 2997]|uniref:Epsin domain-containing protein n=1 Tax=Moniliophthora roreri (strain MCA 2997) TaxID=1381753 RepID=V2X3V9_MONRO|nr:epsin domain-containing protein [Moniliophthora roreri MCA 2997]